VARNKRLRTLVVMVCALGLSVCGAGQAASASGKTTARASTVTTAAAAPTTSDLGRKYLTIVAAGNAALEVWRTETQAYTANTTAHTAALDAAPLAAAFARVNRALLRVEWPPATATDVKALVKACSVLIADLRAIGKRRGLSVARWTTQVVQSEVKLETAAGIVRADLGLPAQTQVPRRGGGPGAITRFRDQVVAWLPILFALLLLAMVFVLIRVIRAMPRTKAAEIDAGSRSAVTWDDVAGVEEARAELIEIVDFLREPERFSQLGARIPRGVVLYGPPGTGKTLLARAVAHESGARFYAASASQFVEMFVGLGAARIRGLFKQARKHAPAIIFIDELDAIGQTRSGFGFNREQDQTLNQLLVEMDGFGTDDRVVVIAASNRLQDLDPALLRPGRFDRRILVSPPDLGDREQILRLHTRGMPLDPDVDLHLFARQTAGLTGADLANLANEAAIFAGRAKRQTITQPDFDNALERVVAGLERRRVISDREKRILAYHEAGHAVMSHLMGDSPPLQKVTIVARGEALGYTLHLPEEDRYLHTREELVDWMKVALAGRGAEQVVFGRVTNGAASDLERVTQLARTMVFEYGMGERVTSQTMRAENYPLSEQSKQLRDEEVALLADGAYEEALRLLDKHRAALDRVALLLLEQETLSRDEMRALLADVEVESRSGETIGIVQVLADRVQDAEDRIAR
jgi:cell division protease FtsH